ncbi:MAG: helix-turn-helix domain-containing protein [Candidatus Levybacteria bacterium]|nr:helix-turn-helix domain-containing protein [Candidatus Levybacteria bacterium]MBP9814824.1 helix-turn-helix domain-containing protein [Candidatus Levybacteria bacterium]
MRNISDILKEERERKGLSVEDVVSATKIRKSFINAIEKGEFQQLPSETYALGFVKNYAHFLGLSEGRAAALYRREHETKYIEIMPKFRKGSVASGRRIMLRSPKGYLITAIAVVVITYIVYQFSFIFLGPKLNIITPKNNQSVVNVISVTGKTDPYATVLVNNEEVYVDLSGSFKKNIYVYSGDYKITVIAKNRFGKETKKEIPIQVK